MKISEKDRILIKLVLVTGIDEEQTGSDSVPIKNGPISENKQEPYQQYAPQFDSIKAFKKLDKKIKNSL